MARSKSKRKRGSFRAPLKIQYSSINFSKGFQRANGDPIMSWEIITIIRSKRKNSEEEVILYLK